MISKQPWSCARARAPLRGAEGLIGTSHRNIKTLLLVFINVYLLVASSFAQEVPRVALFGGYSTGSIPKGWAAGITGNFNRYFGAEAAFSGHYETQENAHDSTHLFLFGPKVALPLHKVTPWVHVLLGTSVVRARLQTNTASGPFVDMVAVTRQGPSEEA
jgi:hypothetical protein